MADLIRQLLLTGFLFIVVFMYALGQGVTKDYAQSLAWNRRAASQGHAHAQYNLGLAYKLGVGAPPDELPVWVRSAKNQNKLYLKRRTIHGCASRAGAYAVLR
jgi:TPR repeat protein